MTLLEAQKKLLAVALAEEGYLEKATNSQLDSKTANAGYNNYTKYARDHAKWGTYHAAKQGLPWCDQFVDWVFITAFGFDAGMKLTCQPKGGYGAGCTESYNYYKAAGQTVSATNAQAGDQIFFGKPGNMTHTGIVTNVDGQYIYTIEGNTGAGDNKVVANGGGVFQKKYTRSYANIGGFGRPKWSLVANIAGVVAQPSGGATASATTTYEESTCLGGVFAEIPFNQIAHIEHVKMNGSRGETITSVAKRAKWNGKAPSIVINAELYTLKDYSPASGVKHNGVMEYAGWQPGVGFKNGQTPVWQSYNNVYTSDWVGGYPAVVQSGVKSFKTPAGLGGNSYRTQIGIKGQTLGILVTKTRCSIDAATDIFVKEKYENVINLDGGASSCFVTPNSSWTRNAMLRGYIAIWLSSGAENSFVAKKSQSTGAASQPTTATATMLLDARYKTGKNFVTTASVLNMRSASGKVITTLKNGTSCQWYGYYTNNMPGMSGKFLYVIAGKYTGFVSEQYVR